MISLIIPPKPSNPPSLPYLLSHTIRFFILMDNNNYFQFGKLIFQLVFEIYEINWSLHCKQGNGYTRYPIEWSTEGYIMEMLIKK